MESGALKGEGPDSSRAGRLPNTEKSLKKTADDMITRWSHAGWNEEEEGGLTKRPNNGMRPLQCAELGAFLKGSFVKKPHGK